LQMHLAISCICEHGTSCVLSTSEWEANLVSCVQGGKLTDAINTRHENPRYLPGVALGANVVATPDLEAATKDADIIIFCTPHQYIYNICKQLRGKVRSMMSHGLQA
jgi:glycerol-3-phosphate dehydrogenase